MIWLAILVLIAAGLGAWWLSGALRRYALRGRMIDVPNRRSSHVEPTPRGAGLAMALVILPGTVFATLMGWLSMAAGVGIVGGGAAVALVGFVDDRFGLGALWRLAGYLAASGWLVAWLGAPAIVFLPGLELGPGLGSSILAVLACAWLINLYNFMDGIDALAATEAATVGIAAAVLMLATGAGWAAFMPALVAVAAMGFLPWNIPPARVFMGDSGSGFLGFAFAGIALWSQHETGIGVWFWLVLLGVFVVDATITLTRRVVSGETWYEAHRCHAYQWAARRYASHGRVVIRVVAVNTLWLAPMAALAAVNSTWGLIVTALAWSPLAVLAVFLGAGRAEAEGADAIQNQGGV